MSDVVIKVFSDVGWSNQELQLLIEMLNIGEKETLLEDILAFIGSGSTHVIGIQHEDTLEVEGNHYEVLMVICNDEYSLLIHEGSYYMIIDNQSEEMTSIILRPHMH